MMWGSPPRARGRLTHCVGGAAGRGLTPACAGTTPGGTIPLEDHEAHPRVRGDDAVAVAVPIIQQGSPPRARGRRAGGEVNPVNPGLTPACAGTTDQDRGARGPGRAHPRVRGDDPCISTSIAAIVGSPPRARGRPRRPRALAATRGLTPACAGTTPGDRRTTYDLMGSPPRARGRPRDAGRA